VASLYLYSHLTTNRMTADSFPSNESKNLDIQVVQDKIYSFLLEIIKKWSPEDVLREFKRLFLDHLDAINLDATSVIYQLRNFIDNEQDFHHTFKRCCYILVNNWENSRKYQYIQQLVEILVDYHHRHLATNKIKNNFQIWLKNFLTSPDFQELKLFAIRSENRASLPWINRYATYLLAAQAVDNKNSQEQQEAARKAYRKLKNKFKFELAMYIAHSQLNTSSQTRYKNPSTLGDDVLRLIKTIVVKKGVFSYKNIANIFKKQIQNQTFLKFKISLIKYLIYSISQPEIVNILQQNLSEKLLPWKSKYDEEIINRDLCLRTCNRVIDYLIIDKTREPSPLLILLIVQGHPLTLAIVLLKIILISPNSRSHLEARIASLIHYYENYSEQECKWLINFLEIFQIAFTIYAENVEYNLINLEEDKSVAEGEFNPDNYQVFSQSKAEEKKTK
jgi:hypothetical protein